MHQVFIDKLLRFIYKELISFNIYFFISMYQKLNSRRIKLFVNHIWYLIMVISYFSE